MPSLGALASSLGLALLAISTTQATPTNKWFETDPSDADESLFLTAIKDLSIYNPDIEDFICAKSVETLYKNVPSRGATKYNFVVNGCIVRSEYVGRCFDSYFYPECRNFDVLISSEPKTETLEVKSIKIHKVKSKATKE